MEGTEMLNNLTVRKPRRITNNRDVLDIVSEWINDLNLQVQAGEISITTAATYQRGMTRFLAWCDQTQVHTIDQETIKKWKASLKAYKANSINAWLSGVRAFFSWAKGKRMLVINPTDGVRGARRKDTSKKHKRETLTDQEVGRLLDQPDTSKPEGVRDLAWISLMLFTAMRTVEVQRAELKDLRTVGNKLVLDVTGKGHDEADDVVVVANPEAQANLSNWLAIRGNKPGPLFWSLSDRSRNQALSSQALRGLWLKYKTAAGIVGNKTAHSLRHTAITSAIRHGATPLQARQMARHKSLDTTMIYYHELDRLTNPAEGFITYDE
jgi:integrase/recombinase XerD